MPGFYVLLRRSFHSYITVLKETDVFDLMHEREEVEQDQMKDCAKNGTNGVGRNNVFGMEYDEKKDSGDSEKEEDRYGDYLHVFSWSGAEY